MAQGPEDSERDPERPTSRDAVDVASRVTVRPRVSRSTAFGTTIPVDAETDTALVLEAIERRDTAVDSGFRVIGELGRGGMAEVLRAHQGALCRDVALKRLHATGPVAQAAFLSEARIMGRLEHTSIVPVHGWVPQADGLPMLAMKLVEGRSWRDVLAAREPGELELPKHVRTLIQVCRCIELAHAQRILHRDLKPENVMIGDYGQVYVMDWGIAVTLDRALSYATGILHVDEAPGPAGTPAYMAPELAEGEAQDERTDVYLLGAILYEILCQQPLHRGASLHDVRAHCLSGEADFPDGLPGELIAIAQRATARRPEHRYGAASELSTALEGYLAHGEAHLLIQRADEALTRIEQAAREENLPAERERVIVGAYAEVGFALSRARELWPEADAPQSLLAKASDHYLAHALATGQLVLAERLASECGDPEDARARVAARQAEAAAREAELARLRDATRRLDWQALRSPLSAVFLFSGVLGLVAAIISANVTNQLVVAASWLSVAVLPGSLAFLLLRRAALPDSLASPRILGLWRAVALACSIHGALGLFFHNDAFDDTHVQASLLGVGFVAMALMTRRWLLWPAAICFVAAVAIGLAAPYAVPIFGGMWFLAVGGVGAAFRYGATLGD